jgi:hypothetical protein
MSLLGNADDEPCSFTLVCQDGEVKVENDEAATIMEHCAFFRNVFSHGTTESTNRVVRKPDWTINAAKDLIQVIKGDRLIIRDLSVYERLVDATDQILFEIDVFPPTSVVESPTIKLSIASLSLIKEISAESSWSTWSLQTTRQFSDDVWKKLLTQKVLIVKETFSRCRRRVVVLRERHQPLFPTFLQTQAFLHSHLVLWNLVSCI